MVCGHSTTKDKPMFKTQNRSIARIELEYDDGEVRRAVGEDADTIWRNYSNAMEYFLVRAGGVYEGPHMEVFKAASAEPSVADAALSLAEMAEMDRERRQNSVRAQ